jgi:hypothetical protein
MIAPLEEPQTRGTMRPAAAASRQHGATTVESEMRARESSSQTPPPSRGAATTPPVWSEETRVPSGDRLVGEIGHELGNYFHKLYYWTEFLQEKRADGSGDRAAGEMLAGTIEKLEGFLKEVLEYFRPLTLSPVRVAVPEAVEAMVVRLRAQLQGWPLRVSDAAPWRLRHLLLDPLRMHAVLDTVGRRLRDRAPAGSGVYVGLEGRGDGIEVVFRLEDGFGAPEFQSGSACVEWALAERVVALHRGRLSERQVAEGSTALVLFLPLDR